MKGSGDSDKVGRPYGEARDSRTEGRDILELEIDDALAGGAGGRVIIWRKLNTDDKEYEPAPKGDAAECAPKMLVQLSPVLRRVDRRSFYCPVTAGRLPAPRADSP